MQFSTFLQSLKECFKRYSNQHAFRYAFTNKLRKRHVDNTSVINYYFKNFSSKSFQKFFQHRKAMFILNMKYNLLLILTYKIEYFVIVKNQTNMTVWTLFSNASLGILIFRSILQIKTVKTQFFKEISFYFFISFD